MPEPAPVTSTTFPLKSLVVTIPHTAPLSALIVSISIYFRVTLGDDAQLTQRLARKSVSRTASPPSLRPVRPGGERRPDRSRLAYAGRRRTRRRLRHKARRRRSRSCSSAPDGYKAARR